MKAYWTVAKNTWSEVLAYRASFILFRVRELLQLFSTYFIWYFVTSENRVFFGYTQATMLTYVIVGAFVNDVIFSTRTTAIASEINEGNLSNFLVKPFSYLQYHFWRDFGDKAMNIIFSICELTVFFFLLHPPFIFQHNFLLIFLFVLSLLFGLILYFFISILISFIGFWSNEGWGPRFIFYQTVGFFSGALFPLDILPKSLYSLFQFSPFTYLTYFPTKLYLGELSQKEIFQGFLLMGIWIIVMNRIAIFVWKKGLKTYTAQGR
ncbi:MAG: ABC-2 family transporter protein [Candidatus Levybacteria bacterium]|nr:ABC-2 family transporter protein [Candidatus Levybacteria bacterium]